jgi:Mn2+/Fe2+ NRAMP family transporter
VKALYWSAVLNRIVAAPVMISMMLLSMRTDIMAGFTLPLTLRTLGWIATVIMATTVVAMGVTWFA